MAKKQTGVSYEDIVRQVRAGEFSPIYCLMGEESYFIDQIEALIVERALREDERDFNLTILYGHQTTGDDVVSAAKRYPMMAERQVVVVREAQRLAGKEALAFYAQKPMPSTVLVLCHKNGKIDGRTNLAKELAQAGTVFESNKFKDYQLPGFVRGYVKEKGFEIEPDACEILCEHVGADLNRLRSELDKLITAVGEGRRIDAQAIQDNVGISKEFNTFELQAALAEHDIMKAARIVKYFDSNPKNFALQPTLAYMFRFFSELMLAYYAPQRTEEGIAAWLGQSTWQVRKNVLPAMRNFSATKVYQILGEIRRTDGASKGVGGQRGTDGDLLKELIFFILH